MDSKMADEDENVDSMETDSASEGKAESLDPPKRPDNLCCYSEKECNLETLKGFDFCHKHILEDKASPFKPCSFISKTNGKKCTKPAPKIPGDEEQKTYCLEHTQDSELRKILEERTKKKKRKLTRQQEEHPKTLTAKPARPAGVRPYNKRPKVLELGTEYRRDDVLRVESSWHGDYESDTESLDNDMDDPLRHAGVWTAEEVTKMCRDKLLRLRSLYMSQFERLKHVYKNKRRKYLLATNANEEGVAGNANGPKSNESLSAFHLASRCYNKRYRADALLQKQSKEKRLGTASRSQTLPQHRCVHYTDGNRCTSKIVPFAKFCLKHICDDPNQQLFLPCSQHVGADQRCTVPVPNVFSHDKCILHLPRTNDLSVVDVEQELQHAREQQIHKEKEKEDRQKATLAWAARENMSEIARSKALAAQQVLKHAEDIENPVTLLPTTASTSQVSSSPISLHSQPKETPTSTNLSSKLSASPATKLQIKTQPEKLSEIIRKNAASVLPPIISQHESKGGHKALVPASLNTSSTDTTRQTNKRSNVSSTLSISSDMQVKPTTASSWVSTKPSNLENSNASVSATTEAIGSTQPHSIGNNPNGTRRVTSDSSATIESTISSDMNDECASSNSNLQEKPDDPTPSGDPKEVNRGL